MPVRSHLRSLLSFGTAVALLVVFLRLINGLPLAVQQDLMRWYGDLEEVRAVLGVRDVLVPSYFPQNLNWPPSTILAQGRPFPAVIMEFNRSDIPETALVISQAAADRPIADGRIGMAQVRERVGYALKGRDAVLDVGLCDTGGPCARIRWREGRYRIDVAARSTPVELIKIAESMLR